MEYKIEKTVEFDPKPNKYPYYKVFSCSTVLVSVYSLIHGWQPFVKCKVRKDKNCEITGKNLKGLYAYRPFKSCENRGHRISADIIDVVVFKQK